MINVIPANPTFTADLPGALFRDAATYQEFAPERRRYEDAVQTFAHETTPAAVSGAVELARLHGFRLTKDDARQAAVQGLRESLSAIGYAESDIRWHAARRGRRDRTLYA
jgi:hypothetical protein